MFHLDPHNVSSSSRNVTQITSETNKRSKIDLECRIFHSQPNHFTNLLLIKSYIFSYVGYFLWLSSNYFICRYPMFKMRDKCKQLTAINLCSLSLLHFYSNCSIHKLFPKFFFSILALCTRVSLSLSLSLPLTLFSLHRFPLSTNRSKLAAYIYIYIYMYIYVYMYMNGRFSPDISLNATYSVR